MSLQCRFAETGEALVSSVDKIIFVGSPGVGRMVGSSSSHKIFLGLVYLQQNHGFDEFNYTNLDAKMEEVFVFVQ